MPASNQQHKQHKTTQQPNNNNSNNYPKTGVTFNSRQMNWIETVSNERVKYNVSEIPLSPFSVWYQQQYAQQQQQ